ncbi:hypothetical protein [Afifella sp. IM 167]|uniref:hypothetical protein n=1 Tax=Afifella sp. IM 167 TaxID=2033586 RepID=UPI001CCE4BA6|nr:hypothetical protein [Afifella sp. IM 167]MBZ8133215.1 hypothetical protein [Afifella sp. IM 167]
MKYQQPFGAADPDASYSNGSRSAGIKGSEVPAAAIEHHQRELVHLITHAGLTPADSDLQQVRKAIEALIAAANGGESQLDTFINTMRQRMLVYPQTLSSDGKINVTSPSAGTILVPPSVTIRHRGVYDISTSAFDETTERTFATAANKTYHLNLALGVGVEALSLDDTTGAGYNPSALAETDSSFDSTYDRALLARIVTDASNVATITPVANLVKLRQTAQETITSTRTTSGEGTFAHVFSGVPLNWARTPDVVGAVGGGRGSFTGSGTSGPVLVKSGSVTDGSGTVTARIDRYGIVPVGVEDTDLVSQSLTAPAHLDLLALA